MPPPTLKVCVLGSTGVGKTKMVKQFVYNQYDEEYEPTVAKSGVSYFVSVVLNGNLYLLRLIDMPMIKEFPVDTLAEWTQYHQCLLRTAHAYIFVFDLNVPATFYYVKVIRDQLFESRNMQNVPVWIVGNKSDQCLNVLASQRRHDHHHHHYHYPHLHTSHPRHNIFHPRPLLHHHHLGSPGTSVYDELTPAFKDLANLVRKQWKCNYVECSVKHDWHVMPILREIVKSLDTNHRQHLLSEQQQQQHSQQVQQTQQQQKQSANQVVEPLVKVVITNASSDKCLNEPLDQVPSSPNRQSSIKQPSTSSCVVASLSIAPEPSPPPPIDPINGANSASSPSNLASHPNRSNKCHLL